MNTSTTEYIELSKRFSNFKDKESLNTSIRQHMYNRKHELTPSAATIFKQIARYAVKYAGCAFLKIATIMEITGFSRSTVIRALKLLQELGIVLKRPMMRKKSGGNGANLYVIQRYQKIEKTQNDTPPMTPRTPDENPDETSGDGVNLESESLINLNPCNKELNTYVTSTFVQSSYDKFKSIVFCYEKNKKLLQKVYGVYLSQIKYLKDAYKEKELLDAALYSLRTTVNKTKTKRIKNLAGYFSGTLKNVLDKLYEQTIENMTDEYSNAEESTETTKLPKVMTGSIQADKMSEEEFENTCADIQETLAFLRSTQKQVIEANF